MSTIKVDTIQSSGGGAVTLTNQEAFKHLLHFNHQTPAIIKSTNTSSVADDATGEYTVTITSAFSDINHIFTISCNYDVDGQPDAAGGQLHSDNSTGNEVAPTTTAYKVRTDGHNSAAKDLKYDYTGAIGDLA